MKQPSNGKRPPHKPSIRFKDCVKRKYLKKVNISGKNKLPLIRQDGRKQYITEERIARRNSAKLKRDARNGVDMILPEHLGVRKERRMWKNRKKKK